MRSKLVKSWRLTLVIAFVSLVCYAIAYFMRSEEALILAYIIGLIDTILCSFIATSEYCSLIKQLKLAMIAVLLCATSTLAFIITVRIGLGM